MEYMLNVNRTHTDGVQTSAKARKYSGS